MRTPFLQFSLLYGAGTALRNSFYDHGWLSAKRLQGPVVSIGNISVGGAGKTPFVIWLGKQLQRRGIRFDVLSRGYGRQSHGVHLVDPNGSPGEFGDEPILIANKLGVPVIVGESRYAAGRLAEATYGPQLHILDDGFQHRALARDFDIVLVSPEDLAGDLLPLGRLREPVSSLRRAHAIVSPEALPPQISALPNFVMTRKLHFERVPQVASFAFCGIAKPEQFFAQLRASGIRVSGSKSFRDHHAYSEQDVRELLRARDAATAEALITTEKDAINLGPLQAKLPPLFMPRIEIEVAGGDTLVDRVAQLTHPMR